MPRTRTVTGWLIGWMVGRDRRNDSDIRCDNLYKELVNLDYWLVMYHQFRKLVTYGRLLWLNRFN